MRIEDRDDFVDLVAQAVIDRLEARDRIEGMVNIVVARVIELQKREAEASEETSPTSAPDTLIEEETDGNH